MAISQGRSLRKSTGGRFKARLLKKKKHSLAKKPILPKIDNKKDKTIRVRGGNIKKVLLQTNEVNISSGKKIIKGKLENVVENPANRNFVRRNILTKGTIVQTDKGNVVITNRPGKDGFVNAKLMK